MILLIPFLVAAGLFVATPGPDVALVTRNAIRRGRRAAFYTALGITTGVLVWAAATSAGLSEILEASPFAFTLVRLAGGGYLCYLGLRTLLVVWRNPKNDVLSEGGALSSRTRSPYLQGVVNNLLNPKVAVLFTSLMPQFLTPGSSGTFEFLELSTIFAVMGLAALSLYSVLWSASSGLLRRASVSKALNGLTGSVLMGFGIRAALETG